MSKISTIEQLETAIRGKGIRTKDRALTLALNEIKRLERENKKLLLEARIPEEVEHGLSDNEKDVADALQISHTIYYLHKKMIKFMKDEDRLLLEIKRLEGELKKHGVNQDEE